MDYATLKYNLVTMNRRLRTLVNVGESKAAPNLVSRSVVVVGCRTVVLIIIGLLCTKISASLVTSIVFS